MDRRFGSRLGDAEQAQQRQESIGARGVAESDLRPSGVARFGDLRESVVTAGDFITSGTPIRIVSSEGARVLVEPDAGSEEEVKGES